MGRVEAVSAGLPPATVIGLLVDKTKQGIKTDGGSSPPALPHTTEKALTAGRQARQAWPRRRLYSAGVILGNEGRTLAASEGTEYELPKREWCPSIGVKHPAASPDGAKCGGQAPHRTAPETVSKTPRGVALVGGNTTKETP